MKKNICLCIYINLFIASVFAESDKVIMCFLSSSSYYRVSGSKFTGDMIAPHLCTHIIHSVHLAVSPSSTVISYLDFFDRVLADSKGLIKQVQDIKKNNKEIKILFSLGGWVSSSAEYTKLAQSIILRRKFIGSVIKILLDNGFDGINMNWYFPHDSETPNNDIYNFIVILKDLKSALKKLGYLIVSFISAHKYVFKEIKDETEANKRSISMTTLFQQVDYVLLQTFDFDNEQGLTSAYAPLHSRHKYSVESVVEKYLAIGLPKRKFLLGFATHGKMYKAREDFQLSNYPTWDVTKEFMSKSAGPGVDIFNRLDNGDDVKYFGVAAAYSFLSSNSSEKGYIGFDEICKELKANKEWTEHWNADSLTPFAVNGRKLISFDNKTSYTAKLRYLKESHLGGAFVWSLDTDDFIGACYGNKYPLVSLIKQYLHPESVDCAHEIQIHKTSQLKLNKKITKTDSYNNTTLSTTIQVPTTSTSSKDDDEKVPVFPLKRLPYLIIIKYHV